MGAFNGKLGIQQRVLPFYRVPFFDSLAKACPAGFELFAGTPRPSEAITTADHLEIGKLVNAKNIHLLSGSLYSCLQPGFNTWLERFQPDALIIEANPRYLTTPAAIRWMKARNKPVIGWGLGAPMITGPFSSIRKSQRINFLRELDAVIAYSKSGEDEYVSSGVTPSRIFVAPNSSAFRPDHVPPERPKQWEGRPQVLFVGRIQARKRLDLLFKACARLSEELRPELTIVGDGPDRIAMEKTAKVVYPSTVFTGMKTGKDLIPFFEKADLFVLPGTGGLAVQEAMSFALPVIVAEGDGTQSQLVRPENGWMVTPGNLDDLVKSMKDALSDIPELRKKGLESYRIARDEVNIEKMVEVFITTINSVSRS